MANPRNATTDDRGGRFYTWRAEQYYSVTTIISGGLPKRPLIYWAAKEVAIGACDLASELPALVEKDREAAIVMLKGLPWAKRDKAASLGTLVHAGIEAYALGKPMPKWPEHARSRMEAFERFLVAYEPKFEATEASVYNRTERYAGTLDAIATVNGRKLILDAKTGKQPYPEVGLQLAAYRFAEFMGLPDGSETPMPQVDGAAVLHLPESGQFDLIEVRCDEQMFNAFLYVREVFRFAEQTSKTVLGGIVPTPERAVA